MDSAIRSLGVTTPRLQPSQSQLLLLVLNACALVACLVLLFSVRTGETALRVGQAAPDTIVAPTRGTFVDRVATAARKKTAIAEVQPSYRHDTTIPKLRLQQAATFLLHTARVLATNETSVQKLAAMRQLLPLDLAAIAPETLLGLNQRGFREVQVRSLALLSQAMNWSFDSNQLTSTEIGLLSTLPAGTTPAERAAINEVVATFLAPTLVVDPVATLQQQQQAARRVAPVMSTIYPGEVLVRRGDIITQTVMDQLTALGMQARHPGWRDVVASLLFSLVVIAMLFWYLHAFHPPIVTSPRLLLLIDVSILLTVLAARLLSPAHILLPLFLPVAAVSTFAAVLIAPEAVVAITLAMAILAGWVVANSFELTIYYFLSGCAGALAVRQVKQLKQFLLAGAYITVFALATALAFGLLAHGYDLPALQEDVLAAVFNGFVSSTLALGGFVLLSDFFGVTTALQLLELGQPNQPLLRRLMVKSPGTYNHSLILASMVERAAEEVGANSLVAKVSALYHDVGKTANPHCFVENQFGMSNIHDELRPEESARIIKGHVSQGLKLAKQFKLPRAVLDSIAEHHGTMTIAYFLHRARQQSSDEPVDASLYTYAGPKPQSKETALLMLADGCETVVRATSDHSRETIEESVRRIFEERIEQGQLDECPLTLQDLEHARQAFCSVLFGLYHPRIEYPDAAEPALPVIEVPPSTPRVPDPYSGSSGAREPAAMGPEVPVPVGFPDSDAAEAVTRSSSPPPQQRRVAANE